MKKTISINISGLVFQIDEDAYDKLNQYLLSLRRHFANTHGKEDILEDIESRIAELLQESLKENKQVVSNQDIKDIISKLGQPVDFEDDQEAEADVFQQGPKRLYRDGDHQILGGVCSGLGAYFRIDPIWFRLAFFLFLFIWGTGVFAYIILWIAVPKASSTAEKLEMRGERVTVENIEKSIRQEFEHIRTKFQDLAGQSKEEYKKKASSSGSVIEGFLKALFSIFSVIFRILVIIIGVALMLTGLGLIISFAALFFGFEGVFISNHSEVINLPFQTLFYLINPSGQSYGFFSLGIVLLIGIPLIMLLYNAARMIFRFERIKYLGLTAFNIWLAGLIIVSIFAFRMARHFQYERQTESKLSIDQPSGDTLFLSLQQWMPEQIADEENVLIISEDIEVAIIEGKKYIGEIDLETAISPDDQFHLIMFTKARGKSTGEAIKNAIAVTYEFQSHGNELLLNNYYILPDSIPWTRHEVVLEIQVPEGKEVKLDPQLFRMQNRYNSRIRIRTHNENLILRNSLMESGIPQDGLFRRFFKKHMVYNTFLY